MPFNYASRRLPATPLFGRSDRVVVLGGHRADPGRQDADQAQRGRGQVRRQQHRPHADAAREVEIVTKFGKLQVPMTEVRKIDLGVHLADGVEEKIQAAMKKLGSENFKEREEAVNQLVALGPGAYPSLHPPPSPATWRSASGPRWPSSASRPSTRPTSFGLGCNDRVVTSEFTIVGRIVYADHQGPDSVLRRRWS